MKCYTNNELAELILMNNIRVLTSTVDIANKHDMSGERLKEYLIEIADAMEAEILVLQLRKGDYVPK